jgi:hypothetical protein
VRHSRTTTFTTDDEHGADHVEHVILTDHAQKFRSPGMAYAA